MDYKNKYLKYKQKYLNLKNTMYGGMKGSNPLGGIEGSKLPDDMEGFEPPGGKEDSLSPTTIKKDEMRAKLEADVTKTRQKLEESLQSAAPSDKDVIDTEAAVAKQKVAKTIKQVKKIKIESSDDDESLVIDDKQLKKNIFGDALAVLDAPGTSGTLESSGLDSDTALELELAKIDKHKTSAHIPVENLGLNFKHVEIAEDPSISSADAEPAQKKKYILEELSETEQTILEDLKAPSNKPAHKEEEFRAGEDIGSWNAVKTEQASTEAVESAVAKGKAAAAKYSATGTFGDSIDDAEDIALNSQGTTVVTAKTVALTKLLKSDK